MTAAARFTQSDVTRAVKGAAAGGMHVGEVQIDPNGNIIVKSIEGAAPTSGPNPWNKVFDKS